MTNLAVEEQGVNRGLERFQEKRTPLFRFESATKQRLGALVLSPSKQETL
jgi:hypothetical protein